MNCECHVLHFTRVLALLKASPAISNLFFASKCSKCGELIQGWYRQGMDLTEAAKQSQHGNMKYFSWNGLITNLKFEYKLKTQSGVFVVLEQAPAKSQVRSMSGNEFLASDIQSILSKFNLT